MPIKIFIDQGHNPENPNAGAEGNGLREQDITYRIGTLLADRLSADPRFEARVSRENPDVILGTSNSSSLAARVNAANSWGAEAFVSLHTNASSAPSASGVEAYAFSRESGGFRLAEDIVGELVSITGLPERGVFVRPSLYVLRRTKMPSALVELGFITNPGDAALMSENPALFAEGIYRGILEYFDLQ